MSMLSYAHINGGNHPVAAAVAQGMLDRPPSEAGSVLARARSYLKLRLQSSVKAL
jgi:hypothetical protein